MSPIFITCGDPNGVGPEVTLKALSVLPEEVRSEVILAGHFGSLDDLNGLLGKPLKLARVQSFGEARKADGIPILELEGVRAFYPSYGRVSGDAGMLAGRGIMRGVEACLKAETSALVTAPASKEALQLAGFQYPGQTEMIASLVGSKRFIMILASEEFRVGLATTHMALREVSRLICRELVLEKIVVLHEALQTWFGIPQPRLAVAALNPHASDGGIFGREESQALSPAIEDARKLKITVEGPLPADALFPRWHKYDGILAMYHDQGMIPIKMAALGNAVNLTSGLPFPRTSPDHGTAFDIAGKLIADPKSMIRAIKLAHELARRPSGMSSRRKTAEK